MNVNWRKGDYFLILSSSRTDSGRAHAALELLIDDLHADKLVTIERLLNYSGSEDLLWGIVRLLACNNSRVSGNAAYILGTIAEDQKGRERIAALATGKSMDCTKILPDFIHLFTLNDHETVMNAVGALGTLAESDLARSWMLTSLCINDLIDCVAHLLAEEDIWTASNAALLLARLLISESGGQKLLCHTNVDRILGDLITSLGTDEAGRGMNAAFAIGRLCDMKDGAAKLLSLTLSDKMVSLLIEMLSATNISARKNACFALSCLSSSQIGLARVLHNSSCDRMVDALGSMLTSGDLEAAWFSAMTLKTMAKQPKGCQRLRDSNNVMHLLKMIDKRTDVGADLLDEVHLTLELIKPLEAPCQPTVDVLGWEEIQVQWKAVSTSLNIPVSYRVFEASRIVYEGRNCQCKVSGLQPNTEYTIRVVAVTELEDSLPSEPTIVRTHESVPGPPLQLQVLVASTTQIKVGWQPPAESHGGIRAYHVYLNGAPVTQTSELLTILSGLQPNTTYEVSVCAATAVGKGEFDCIYASTTKLGLHAPAKPDVSVRGRHEVHVTWHPPVSPLGRITRYELCVDGEIVYSGTDLHCAVRRLKPDTEYSFVVSVVTSEGRFDSKPAKKRTSKDEFEVERSPLHLPPKQDGDVVVDDPETLKPPPDGENEPVGNQLLPSPDDPAASALGDESSAASTSSLQPSINSTTERPRRRVAWADQNPCQSATRCRHQPLANAQSALSSALKSVQKMNGIKPDASKSSATTVPRVDVRGVPKLPRSKSDLMPRSRPRLGQHFQFPQNRVQLNYVHRPSVIHQPVAGKMSQSKQAEASKLLDLSDAVVTTSVYDIESMRNVSCSGRDEIERRTVETAEVYGVSSLSEVEAEPVLQASPVVTKRPALAASPQRNSLPLRLQAPKPQTVASDLPSTSPLVNRRPSTSTAISRGEVSLSTQLLSFPKQESNSSPLAVRRSNTFTTSNYSFSPAGNKLWQQASSRLLPESRSNSKFHENRSTVGLSTVNLNIVPISRPNQSTTSLVT